MNTEKQRFRHFVSILTVLSLVVAAAVSWNLRITGINLANDASCGYPEHRHSEECIQEKVLSCTEPEESMPEETTPAHVHTADCYQISYGCGYEEHIHVIDCYSDNTVDLESPARWEATVPTVTGIWAEDLVSIVRSQLGNGESERNYLASDDGLERNGITRYGQWYGNPYGDWSAMFVMFCLNYAQVPEEAIPRSPGVYNMMRLAQDQALLRQVDPVVGTPGNILFLDTDGNGNADRMLIVSGAAGEDMTAIGGDWEDAVREITLTDSDPRLLGYIHVAGLQEDSLTVEATEPTESAEATEPTHPPATSP